MKEKTMKRLTAGIFALTLIGTVATPTGAFAQEATEREIIPPTKSQDQKMNRRNTIPRDFPTHIAAQTEQDKARAQMIIELYAVLAAKPTPENMLKYVSDTYIQHNTMAPDGAHPIAMMFAASVAEYPVEIDVHKVMVSGDWAMAHVNFRNLDSSAEDDLGSAAVDMYLFGPDGKVEEHWDVLQEVPTHSASPHGMFLKVFEGE
jgi:predicted SnoaL-like aldol condensation-catalyzing enzyme